MEVTGARLLIPWFGSSILVWSNVIGVTLGSLAVGNFIGGRLADRRPRAGLLALLLSLAAVLTGLAPYEIPWLAQRYLPEGMELASAFALIGRASLLTAILAFGPPLLLLGTATPFLIRGATREGRVARSAGLISGAATVGSLLGTWLPVYYLVPELGSRMSCVVAGFALAGGAVVALVAGRVAGRAAVVAALLSLVGLGLMAGLAERSVGRGATRGEVLAEQETRYQYARVERYRDQTGEWTALRLNEGLDSFHSLLKTDAVLTDGAYYDYYGLFPPLVGQAGRPRSILILGFAAGTIARQILLLHGEGEQALELKITGVELDPAVADFGREYFDLPDDPRLEVVTDQDARVFLNLCQESYDLIVVDTYADQIYVPFQTCSLEFFRTASSRLNPGGALVANLGGFTVSDLPIRAIRNTAARVFGEIALLRVAAGRNFVLCAGQQIAPPDPRNAGFAWPEELLPMVAASQAPGAWQTFPFDEAELVLTDDRSPIELLADRDLLSKSTLQMREVEGR